MAPARRWSLWCRFCGESGRLALRPAARRVLESEQLRALPLWRNYRVQAALLLVLTACLVVVFRSPLKARR